MRNRRFKWDVKSIKHAINAYDFYLAEQDLIKFDGRSGQWLIAGICPFHEDRKSGSFKVNVKSGAYICFSCNEKGGDIITFTQKKYGLSFCDALQKLATEWRVL